MKTNEMSQEQVIRLEALRLAIFNKEKNGSRYTTHAVADAFSDYIRSDKAFRID